MDLKDYRRQYEEGDGPGWDAISRRLAEVYPNIEPVHYIANLHAALGGQDYLNGVSQFRSGPDGRPAEGAGQWHYHYVSYGFSDLFYDESSVGQEFSGWGFELTFRLAPFADDGDSPAWPVSMMQNIARYVFQSRRGFDDYHCMPANGPIRLNTQTSIVGLAFVTDPVLGVIDTPHGEVKFLQAVGITEQELARLKAATLTPAAVLQALSAGDPLLVTDLCRRSETAA